MKPATILVVDDEPLLVDWLVIQLSEFGYQTLTVNDGRDALRVVAEEKPDLILLDVDMPVMGGIDVCRVLKMDEATHLIPIIFMTTLAEVDDRIRGIEAGADDYLIKPIHEGELHARIDTALRQKALIEQRLGQAEKISEQFSKFVPEIVKRRVSANPDRPGLEKREREVSVLFADICDYTRMGERLTHGQLTDLVETYFAAYIDLIHANGGDVAGTAGDGIMAVFHEGSVEDHAVRAADTAQGIVRITERMNRERGMNPIRLHMGINAGVASFGAAQFEGESGSRWVFTADGPVVNLASRIADCAPAGQIYLGPGITGRLKGRYRTDFVGHQRLKNVASVTPIHQLQSRH